MIKLRAYLLPIVLLCAAGAGAQDTTHFYESIHPYAGFALVRLSRTTAAPGLFAGMEGGERHFRYDIRFLTTLSGGNSGVRWLSAYAHMTTESVEVPFETRSEYRAVAFSVRYYVKDTEITDGSNYYAGIGTAMQHYRLTPHSGQYDPGKYYVQDELYKLNRNNDEISFALRIACGYQYRFASGLSLLAGIDYDQRLFNGTKFSGPLFKHVNALMIGAGASYKLVIVPRKERKRR